MNNKELFIILIFLFILIFYLIYENYKYNKIENFETNKDLLGVGKDNDILINFCEKIKLLNKTSEKTLTLRKFKNDFVEKKNKYIDELKNKIDKLLNEIIDKENNDYNQNKVRINDQASHQIDAIKQAMKNLDSNKLNLNIV